MNEFTLILVTDGPKLFLWAFVALTTVLMLGRPKSIPLPMLTDCCSGDIFPSFDC